MALYLSNPHNFEAITILHSWLKRLKRIFWPLMLKTPGYGLKVPRACVLNTMKKIPLVDT